MKFRVSWLSVKEMKIETDFQDGRHGGHWPLGSGEEAQNRFTYF